MAAVLEKENADLGVKPGEAIGLALSGGGIRSASFALGVVQALIHSEVLEKFHYLSTVSGGGYLGAAIQWLRARHPDNWADQLGHEGRGVREIKGGNTQKFNWFDFIRQHGNYLQPSGIGTLSLVGVAARGALVSVALYFSLLVLFAIVPYALGIWQAGASSTDSGGQLRFWTVSSMATTLLALALNYSFATYLASRRRMAQIGYGAISIGLALAALGWSSLSWCPSLNVLFPVAVPLVVLALLNGAILGWVITEHDDVWPYRIRVRLQQKLGALLAACIVVTVVCVLPWIYFALQSVGRLTIPITDLLGIAGAAYQATLGRGKQTAVSGISGELRVYASIVILLLGMALSAYWLAGLIFSQGGDWIWKAVYIAATALVLFAFMWFTNLNLFNLGRMYRDRLMESFLPDPQDVEQNQWDLADQAERDYIKVGAAAIPQISGSSALKEKPNGLLSELWPAKGRKPKSLYPIFNTNAILVDARKDRFRGRGGDNFILTPKYCGSDATGLAATEKFAHGTLTLATAMAVSAAAVNPDSGCDGRGITRNRLVAFLMFLVQARLGCWFVNPKWLAKSGNSDQKRRTPNFIRPGIQGGLFGRGSNEEALFIELCDGGHFENLGAYELIRRRCKLIVIVSAGADVEFQMEDLGNLVEKVRVDFGVGFDFDTNYSIDDIRPKRPSHNVNPPFADRGFAIARIGYPHIGGAVAEAGWLLYLQATPIKSVPEDVRTYQRLNPDFPNETTADQFFDETQVEAYRELGWAIARDALKEVGVPMSSSPSQVQHQTADASTAIHSIGNILA
ncbi:hypothetical protein ELE36_07040 [Pseudolysobacter antarcticus]|uniref:PNPLA domain-containing protein n=2 Tax=Pseudolysobacter antarcticus TaxID=2511995 RepID=A0A411HQ64_9GAMM|nr:hypothetical protein ELE36_07040 [Pseudolysobacter antarcticus]